MELLARLPRILEESKAGYEDTTVRCFNSEEQLGSGENMLAVGDNLEFMRFLIDERDMAGKLQLIYIDPPFFSRSNYDSAIKLGYEGDKTIPVIKQMCYMDSWQSGMEDYLKMICTRLYAMKELLSDEGIICVHLDWHVVHYVKVLMDVIFGEKNFINEIIWHYKSGGSTKKRFSRKHDTILMYAKTKHYKFNPLKEKSYNRGYKPYRFKGVKEYRDEIGWYTVVNMKDVWQIDMVGRTSAERTGYITQKPEALLDRLIQACTDEGDICADFFGGSGTMAAAAQRTKRPWIYCDAGNPATINAQKRLVALNADFTVMRREGLADSCTVEAEVLAEPAEIAKETLLTVKLLACRPDCLAKIPVKEEDQAKIKKIIQKDSLQLVDYWSVDCNYDGIIHRPREFRMKGKCMADMECKILCKDKGEISIRVVDIFGNSTIKVISR